MAYEGVSFFQDEWSIVWALSGELPPEGQPPRKDQIRPIALPDPEFANLFSASLILYKIAGETRDALSIWIEALEKNGGEEAVNAFQDIAGNLNTACRAAEQGLAKVFADKRK